MLKRILTNREMQLADEYTMKQTGITSRELMLRAATAVADEAMKMATLKEPVLVVCGGGNNGGDGFACACILRERGKRVRVVCLAKELSADCAYYKEEWIKGGGVVEDEVRFASYSLIIDAMIGTGSYGKLSHKYAGAVRTIEVMQKRDGVKVLAVDSPSGVDGQGGVDGAAIRADVTLCIGEYKLPVFVGEGRGRAGIIKRADIGILLPQEEYVYLLDKPFIRQVMPPRYRDGHKGSFGRVAIVGGSAEYSGAPYLSAKACMRSGAGYVCLFLPDELLPHYILRSPELLLKGISKGARFVFDEERMKALLSYDAIAYGMGMGTSMDTFLGLKWLLANYEGRLLLDADALNSLSAYGMAEMQELLLQKKCAVVITPHAKEFSRMTQLSVHEIVHKGFLSAPLFSELTETTVVLKGATTLIAHYKGVWANARGNTAQAKAGSGDVLSGVIAGLLAQHDQIPQCAVAGAYLTGVAAELAARDMGEYSVTPSDLIDYLGKAFLFVTEYAHEEGCEE